jgi:hypothetical protein
MKERVLEEKSNNLVEVIDLYFDAVDGKVEKSGIKDPFLGGIVKHAMAQEPKVVKGY